jgi:V/A-type H+-transporting ATPase subunit I
MIAQMDRIEVVFLRSELRDMVAFLQDRGVVHLEDVPLALENHPGYLHRIHLPREQKEELAALEELQGLLNESLPLLVVQPDHAAIIHAGRTLKDTSVTQWRELITQRHRELRTLSRRKLNIQDNIEVLENYNRMLQNVGPLLSERNARLGETARAMVVDRQSAEAAEVFEKTIVSTIGPECDIVRRPFGRSSELVLVTYPPGRDGAVTALLQQQGILAIDVPDQSLKGLSVEQAIDRVGKKIAELHRDQDEILSQLQVFAEQQGPQLKAVETLLGDRLAQLRAMDRFAQSEMIGVAHGWVPTDQYGALASSIQQEFGARAAIDKRPKGEVEITRVPTLLKNPKLFRPFELLLGIFQPPTYGSLDPTILVAISFILFYGFILGDAGYGLFIVGIGMWAKRKWGYNPMIAQAMTIAQWMGVSSIVFGIFYAEFFGDLPYRFFGVHGVLHRMHAPLLTLFIAFGVGLVHIPLSLCIGIWQGYKHHDHHHAEEKLGMLLGLAALGIFLLSVTAVFPLGSTLGYIAAILVFSASLFFLFKSMGAMFAIGVVEIIGLSSNILSYGRLMALGMASVALADLANKLLDLPGAWAILVGIPAAGLIHLLNIGIGVFSPTIHSLRLNYVEFLPKFYEPEGRNYEPFRKEMAW